LVSAYPTGLRSLGGATTFTVYAANIPGPHISRLGEEDTHTQFDVEVKISLSNGLDFAGTPQAPSGTTFDTSTSIWDVGTLPHVTTGGSRITRSLPVAATLTNDSLATIPPGERCLTAEVVSAVPWPSRRKNDTATVCLGDTQALLTEGKMTLVEFYPCIGVTSSPCTSADTLELVAPASRSEIALPGLDRVDTFSSGTLGRTWLQPEEVLIHVPDPRGRGMKAESVIWSTVDLLDLRDSQTRLTSDWSIKESVTVTAPGGGDAPGRWLLVTTNETLELLDAPDSSKVSYDFISLLDEVGNDPNDYFLPVKIDFWAMGTYKALFEISGRLSGTTYTDSGTYTFHVGPISELEVRDGGASPEVGAGDNAYTVMAANNGPDIAPAVQVTGMPTGVTEFFASDGSYDSTSGVWTIGELDTGPRRRASGKTPFPTLALITDDTDPITAAIENTQDYAVCIGSDGNDIAATSESACTGNTGASWHTAAYLDHIPGNNTATIMAHAGTGEGHPGAPVGVKAMATPAANILTWQPVERLNGFEVTHYQVQRSASPWTTLDSDVKGTAYVDTASETGHPTYRVRAVNQFDVPGPWSEPSARRPGAPGDFTASGSSDAQATLSWSAPAAVSGVTVTGYDVEFSQDGGNAWSSLETGLTAFTYTHTDSSLATDTVRQYRVRAVSTVGSGSEQVVLKSDWVFAAATRDYLTPGAPRNFTARAINQSRVDLSWSVPAAVDGVTLTGYHLEFSTDGNSWNWLPAGPARTALSATTTSHTHTDNTLAPGALRQYRVRAVGTGAGNAVFESVWVFANAATEAVGAPQNLAATADGRGRIDLRWDQPGFGADRVTGYRIDYTPASPESWQTVEHGYRTSPRRYEHDGLKPGQEYCYRVAATYAGGTGPFAARACATTEGAPTDLPGEPENLRVTHMGSDNVTLAWDAPSVGGAVEYYEWGSNYGDPVRVSPRTATSVRVGGLTPGSNYDFQVRAGNSHGVGKWSKGIRVTLDRAGSAMVITPQELDVEKGGSGSFNVRLRSSPQWPVMVYFHSIGPECLTEGLVYQQFKILLPSNPQPSKEFWESDWWGPSEDRSAVPWNKGVDLHMDASSCQGGETTVIEPHISSLPFSFYLEGVPMWDDLGLNEEEWREKWGVDRLDGVIGPSVKVTVVDDGTGTQQSSETGAGRPTTVTVALGAAAVSESAGQVTVTATRDAAYTMPNSMAIHAGERLGTGLISSWTTPWTRVTRW